MTNNPGKLPALTVVAIVLASSYILWSGPASTNTGWHAPLTTVPHENTPDRVPKPAKQVDETLATLFSDDVPDVRLFACERAGRSGDPRWIPALLVRLADTEPVVRRASLAALAKPSSPAGLLQANVDGNETQLLLELVGSQNLSICELWADSSYTSMPAALMDACLNCHAGQQRLPFARNEQCQTCHESIYAEWSRSAHAQSVVHLPAVQLKTPASEPAGLPPEVVHGISCVECHTIDSMTNSSAASEPTSNPSTCPHKFARPTEQAQVCVRCHADTDAQWRDWLELKSKPRHATWPPGDLSWIKDDRRTCVDCHMPPLNDSPTQSHRVHSWSARRNLPLLKQGTHLAASIGKSETDSARFDVTLTNTAGHSWPTGTCRRTIELIVDAPAPAGPTVIARIGGIYPTRVTARGIEPPLAPGERRSFHWLPPAGCDSVNYRLRYIRDRLIPTRYSADILTGERPVR